MTIADVTLKIEQFTFYICYVLTALIGLCALAYVFSLRGLSDPTLIMLCATIATSCALVVWSYYEEARFNFLPLLYASAMLTGQIAQWLISQIYVRVIIELNALLSSDIHFGSAKASEKFQRQKLLLYVCSGFAILACCVSAYLGYIGLYDIPHDFSVRMFWIQAYVGQGIDLLFLIVWATALVKLLRQVKVADKLIPNGKMFIAHAILLSIYFVMILLTIYTNSKV